MSTRKLGPIHGATLLTRDLTAVSHAYQKKLGYTLTHNYLVSDTLAQFWSAPRLAGNPVHVLASSNDHSWLRIVEDKQAAPAKPLKAHGWMSLEVNVADTDALRERFNDDTFKVIGEPAYLQVSDAIKAMQVIGPAGEVSYLTQVEREVPPFELPMSETETGSLFIPVLCTPDRDASVAFYEQLNDADKALKFDTKITVLNHAWGYDIDHQFPVATLQLDGKCLFEIDEVPQAGGLVENPNSLPSGIALITSVSSKIDHLAEQFNLTPVTLKDPYYPAKRAVILKGPGGELLEVIGD